VTVHPEGAKVCLDAGYVWAQKVVEGMGYKAHIRPRGEEKQEKKKNPQFGNVLDLLIKEIYYRKTSWGESYGNSSIEMSVL
jgi:hypothetical protein